MHQAHSSAYCRQNWPARSDQRGHRDWRLLSPLACPVRLGGRLIGGYWYGPSRTNVCLYV